MPDHIEKRIDRFESSMDKNFEKVTQILEKLARHDERVDDVERRIGQTEDDVRDLKKIVSANEYTAKSANRIFWMVLAGFVSLGFYFLRG
jgi:septal ring factor EnvC (AmiA/AmiB activator)